MAKLQDQDNGNGRVAWSPDGKWIVCASGWGLTIWSASGDDYHKVDTIYSDAISPAWGRDSRWIATDGDIGAYLHPINENGTFDLSGTRRLGSSNYPYMTPRSVAWNTTGFQLVFSDVAAQKIHIYDVETNTEIQAIEFADYFAGEVDWSPDGTKIAYGASDKTVRVVDIASEQELGVYSTGKIGVVEKVAWSPDGRYLAFPQAGEIPQLIEFAQTDT